MLLYKYDLPFVKYSDFLDIFDRQTFIDNYITGEIINEGIEKWIYELIADCSTSKAL